MRDPGSPSFSTAALRVTACHAVTYFIAGVFAVTMLDYRGMFRQRGARLLHATRQRSGRCARSQGGGEDELAHQLKTCRAWNWAMTGLCAVVVLLSVAGYFAATNG
jgi:hypothetical protein